MDAVLACGFFLALAVAGPLWGHDSRDRLRSLEERLAACGHSWRNRFDGWDPEWWERSAVAEAPRSCLLA